MPLANPAATRRSLVLSLVVVAASLSARIASAETPPFPLVASLAPSASTVTETPEPDAVPPPGTHASPYDAFGKRGTRALGLAIDIGSANSGLSSRPLGMGGRVTLDTFVLEGLSIGGQFGFEYASVDGSFYNVGGGPRVGYALRLGDKLALWPMAMLTYDSGTVPLLASASLGALQDVRVGASLPLVMTLGGQVAIDMGPVVSTDLWRTVDGQSAAHMGLVELRTGIMGWF